MIYYVKLSLTKTKKGEMTLVNELTPLCEAIKCEENNPNQLIVIEGVSKASPSVLEILNNIYGKKGTEILLPNGSTIIKGNVLLISIFNPSDDFTKEKLPINMINNSIYFIMENPNKKDCENIIDFLLKKIY